MGTFWQDIAAPFKMSLEQLRVLREAEANEEIHVTWQEKAAIGKTVRQASNPNWREDGEAAWAKF